MDTEVTSVLKNLTRRDIMTAFKKAEEDTKVPGFKLHLVTDNYINETLEFMRDHFISEEIVHKSSGVEWTDELANNYRETLELNLSLIFVSEANDEVAAVLLLGVQRKNECVDFDKISTKSFKEMLRFIKVCDHNADFFGHYDTDEAFHYEALAVAKKYRRLGLATAVVNGSLIMVRNFGIDPVYVKIEGSSKYSKKVFEDAGFQTLGEVSFDTWDFPVKTVRADEHTSQKNYGLKITGKSG